MYEIESVLMNNDENIVEEYLDETEQHSPQEPKEESPPKKKIPIIRKPGEIVTPVYNRRTGAVKISSAIIPPISTAPKVTPTRRLKTQWQKVAPYGIKTTLKVTPPSPVEHASPQKQHVELDDNSYDDGDVDASQNGFQLHSRIKPELSEKVTLETLDAKLNALDDKLNRIVAKLGEHDNSLKSVKYTIRDLRNELTSVSRTTNLALEEQARVTRVPKRRRQPQIVFPIADDNYFLKLEMLVQTDSEIREELFDHFLEASGTDVFSYMRKNVGYLFNNTSKYTWTGKPSNFRKDLDPAGVASQLAVVEVLIESGIEKFPNLTRDDMEREFRRGLQRFNDAKFFKRRKRALLRLAEQAAKDAQEAEGSDN